jgi:hypothetical protein
MLIININIANIIILIQLILFILIFIKFLYLIKKFIIHFDYIIKLILLTINSLNTKQSPFLNYI